MQKDKEYPLLCDFCNTKEKASKRKIYKVEVSEILVDKTDSKYPHTMGDFRQLQVCENCFRDSDINKILIKENRQFK